MIRIQLANIIYSPRRDVKERFWVLAATSAERSISIFVPQAKEFCLLTLRIK